MKRNSEITAAQYLHPDYDTAYDWDQEEVRDDVWFDCNNKRFLTFDEVLSIAGESTGFYRPQAKHEANTDIDGFIDKYLYGTKIYPVWFEEVIESVAADFEDSSYNEVIEGEDSPLSTIIDFVYNTYAGITAKVTRVLSADNNWWFTEILKQVDINYTDGLDWSEDAMFDHGADLYSTYGPGNFDDMTDYDWESHQLYQRRIGASSDIDL